MATGIALLHNGTACDPAEAPRPFSLDSGPVLPAAHLRPTHPPPFKAGPFGTPQGSLASRRLTLISGTNAMTGLSTVPAKMLVILKIRV